jgi:hypothetical protein
MNFTVERYWKGKPNQATFVFTAQNSSCAVGFADGDRYLVFALVYDNGDINTNLCLRPGAMRERRQYLKLLGRGATDETRLNVGRNMTDRWTRAAGARFSTCFWCGGPDASGLIRAAASTQPLGGFRLGHLARTC